jgi:hypothetical protein
LQGKFNAEVPRLNAEVKTLKEQLETVMAQLANKPAAPDLSALTAEEREQYGEDFLKVVAKVAAAQAPATQSAPTDLTDRLARIEDVVAETKEDAFFRKLVEAAPTWEALNTDNGFLAWLAETDTFTGATRQSLFNDAYQRLDVKRVASFFNAYGGNQSSVSRTDQLTPLESQVTPRPNTSAAAPPQGKKLWTNREIAKFYDDMRRGVYKDNIADAARIEQDIFAAQTEGRVR